MNVIVNLCFNYLDPNSKKILMNYTTHPIDMYDVPLSINEYYMMLNNRVTKLNIVEEKCTVFNIPSHITHFKGSCVRLNSIP